MTDEVEFEMNKFGPILTDRADGKKAYAEMIGSGVFPTLLDFSGIISLGSSFGDELIPKLAEKNSNKISVKNANVAIKSCLKKIVEDTGIEVIYLS